MGLFSSITSALNPSNLFGGGGGGGSSSMTSGGIGSETGNTSNAGNSTSTTTTTTTTNTDKRQVINTGGVGVATDSSPITINSTTTDPGSLQSMLQIAGSNYGQMLDVTGNNYGSLLTVTDHLATGTLQLLAANMDAANNQTLAAMQQKASASASDTANKSAFDLKAFYTEHKTAVMISAGMIAYLLWSKR